MRPHSSVRAAARFAAAAIGCAAISVSASSPKFFQAATLSEFLKGDVENLSIDTRGQLALGPATELVYETASPFLWSLAPAPDGVLFVGAGNDGKVFRIDAQGKGTTFFDAAELEVHAIAPAPNGGLYVGSSPDGKIYKVDRSGTATTFFEPQEKYVWALLTDSRGNLYAATGDKGVVYKIAPDGKGEPFYRTKATHATALAMDKAGNLFVGTESPGRVLKIDADGKGFLLLDSPFQEIRALHFDDKGALYVAAVNGRPSSGGPPAPSIEDRPERGSGEPTRAPVPSVSTEITSVSIGDAGASVSSSGSAREDRRAVKGAVYRIAPDGLWDQIWESREDLPYDLAFDVDGRTIVGTGNKGKIYRLEGNPLRPTLLARASAQQITALYRDPKGRLFYATANPGKVFRLTSDRAAEGTYESEPRDAEVVASWGTISWRGTQPSGTRIQVSTRSGNTDAPDEAWSPWSAPYADASGSPIVSPKARYLQWRVVLSGKGASPILTSVTAAYLQRNTRPIVRSITIHPPGIVFQKPYSTGDPDLAGFENQTTPDRKLAMAAMNSQQPSSGAASLGRRTYQKGLQTLIWRADDENDDELVYEVDYRREGETSWKVLRRDLTEAILVWDTTAIPNGTYFVRIIASDAPSNGAAAALTGELDSSSLKIDNTPPEIAVQRARVDNGKTIIAFDVKDEDSPIQRAEYSQDGQTWRAIFPLDGIADSKLEHYELTIDGLLGPRGVSLRASDAMNNVATTEVQAPSGR